MAASCTLEYIHGGAILRSFVMLVAAAHHLLIQVSHKLPPSQLTMGDPHWKSLQLMSIRKKLFLVGVGRCRKHAFTKIPFLPESIAAVPRISCDTAKCSKGGVQCKEEVSVLWLVVEFCLHMPLTVTVSAKSKIYKINPKHLVV